MLRRPLSHPPLEFLRSHHRISPPACRTCA
jgi:hypothetical protein